MKFAGGHPRISIVSLHENTPSYGEAVRVRCRSSCKSRTTHPCISNKHHSASSTQHPVCAPTTWPRSERHPNPVRFPAKPWVLVLQIPSSAKILAVSRTANVQTPGLKSLVRERRREPQAPAPAPNDVRGFPFPHKCFGDSIFCQYRGFKSQRPCFHGRSLGTGYQLQ